MILKDCLEKIIDNRGRNPKYYDNEAYPVIDNVMIKNNYHPNINEATRFIDQDTHDNFLRGYLEPNIPIMTLVGGGIGNVSLSIDEKSVIVQNTIGFKTKPDVLDSIYLYYWFLYKHDELIQFNRGSGQPSIRKTDIENMNIELKDINYQKKVSKILSKIDEKIELNNKINNNLYEFSSQFFNKIYDSILDNYADLENYVSFSQGKQVGIENQYTEQKGNMKRFLRIIDFTNANEPVRYVEDFGDRYFVNKKDVVMIRYGSQTCGKVVRGKEGIIANNMFKINMKEINLNNYIYYYLNKSDIQSLLTSSQNSSTMPSINFSIMNKLQIKVPDDKIIKKFNDVIEPIRLKIVEISDENERLSELRDTLLPKLMNGEIDLDNIEI